MDKCLSDGTSKITSGKTQTTEIDNSPQALTNDRRIDVAKYCPQASESFMKSYLTSSSQNRRRSKYLKLQHLLKRTSQRESGRRKTWCHESKPSFEDEFNKFVIEKRNTLISPTQTVCFINYRNSKKYVPTIVDYFANSLPDVTVESDSFHVLDRWTGVVPPLEESLREAWIAKWHRSQRYACTCWPQNTIRALSCYTVEQLYLRLLKNEVSTIKSHSSLAHQLDVFACRHNRLTCNRLRYLFLHPIKIQDPTTKHFMSPDESPNFPQMGDEMSNEHEMPKVDSVHVAKKGKVFGSEEIKTKRRKSYKPSSSKCYKERAALREANHKVGLKSLTVKAEKVKLIDQSAKHIKINTSEFSGKRMPQYETKEQNNRQKLKQLQEKMRTFFSKVGTTEFSFSTTLGDERTLSVPCESRQTSDEDAESEDDDSDEPAGAFLKRMSSKRQNTSKVQRDIILKVSPSQQSRLKLTKQGTKTRIDAVPHINQWEANKEDGIEPSEDLQMVPKTSAMEDSLDSTVQAPSRMKKTQASPKKKKSQQHSVAKQHQTIDNEEKQDMPESNMDILQPLDNLQTVPETFAIEDSPDSTAHVASRTKKMQASSIKRNSRQGSVDKRRHTIDNEENQDRPEPKVTLKPFDDIKRKSFNEKQRRESQQSQARRSLSYDEVDLKQAAFRRTSTDKKEVRKQSGFSHTIHNDDGRLYMTKEGSLPELMQSVSSTLLGHSDSSLVGPQLSCTTLISAD